ncbi:fatty acid synthase S-acetyltransferase [Pyrenophora tritici-repentis Pt-1C-BFP]|uniref:Fatty acid synthase S-acetyltransferase n=1 Tax=Pyrenophora tritici-repentis (strain Pt-1C-BFP) TaxID=426418 RepID=B2WPC0_PYRTR|nr:fatty acid synthase S-acetyltransferase [Pyrenophora tritici-repentis Pt-1C-BFP]EDU45986.1 fatty acid synthase S-acetyltransferase [Pyrenophora tritici-repentis Pt-1C-BFP]
MAPASSKENQEGSGKGLDYSSLHVSTPNEPVAIIGMAMRLPGNVKGESDFWNLLSEKKSGLCDIPRNRFNLDGFYDSSGTRGTIPFTQGYFLDGVNIQNFDTTVFPTSKTELDRLDPAQRQLLQVAYECFESAGMSSWRGSNTGCYIGEFGEDWADVNAKETQHIGGYRATGFEDFALSNRISYEFDLRGPSMTVKTACSSSLVCLDLACEAIRNGKCDAALVGGINLIFSPTMWITLNDMELLSPRGQSRPFDATADGYARGEAVNMVLVRKLSSALRDKDSIRALIRGTGVNSDGRTLGMVVPNPLAQANLIRRTYSAAGIPNLSETAIIECHATGTQVGDSLEAKAIADCFGDKGIIITSVKANVGHAEGAAGLTSVIKSVLALEHRMVLPNISFETPNPKIPFKECKLHVPIETEPWPKGRAERISVNSFGIGGVNAHVIIESYRQFNLDLQIDAKHSLTTSVPSVLDGWNEIKAILVFTGQGAQWPTMGAHLWDTNIIFRETIQKLDRFLQTMETPPLWKIEHELHKGENDSRVYSAELGHPLCVAIQIALVDVIRSWGVIPHGVIGHSSGEAAAAYASGAITAEAAIAVAASRGFSNVPVKEEGSMAAVGLGRDDVLPFLLPGVDIACENSQLSTTLSGDTEAVKEVLRNIQAERPGVLARLLRVERAYHSHHMLRHGETYEKQITPYVQSCSPTIPFYSSVTGKLLTGDSCLDAQYWRANMERPVLFNSALRSSFEEILPSDTDKAVLIEIGPHPALAGPIGQILRDTGRNNHILHIGSLRRGNPCDESLMYLAGKLYQQGLPLNYEVLCPPGKFVKNLPRYPWKQDITHWLEPRISREWRFREHPPHELLGSRVFESAANEPVWRKVFTLNEVPWLAGHEVNGDIIFPAAGYIAMVGEAIQQLSETEDGSSDGTFSMRNVRIASALVLKMDKITEIITSFKRIMVDSSETTPWFQFTISSFDGTRWARNCFGEARASQDSSFAFPRHMVAQTGSFPRKVDEKTWYTGLRHVGFNYTGDFEGMQNISAATTMNEAKATVEIVHTHGKPKCSRYVLHPAVIDQFLQLIAVASSRGLCRDLKSISVPTFIEELLLHPCPADHTLEIMANVTKKSERGSIAGNVVVKSAGYLGEPVTTRIGLKGLEMSAMTRSNDDARVNTIPLISQFEWMPHSDFVDLRKHFHRKAPRINEWPLLEELVLLCMFNHCEGIQTNDDTAEHLAKLMKWMQAQVQRYIQGANKFVNQDILLEKRSVEERVKRVDEIMRALSSSPYAAFSKAAFQLFSVAPAIFRNEMHPLHVMMENNVLTDFYDALSVDSADMISILANTNPNMRILEVGAGTGGTTANILRALTSSYGERLYSVYTYTDVSSGFMAAAKERFSSHAAIEYAVLDVTKDPAEQGFQLGSFDLIIAANVLHATPSLRTTLCNMRSLLSPRGRLFLEELNPEMMCVNYVMGFLSGWWLGALDDRVDQPFISPERWTKELLDAGFPKPEAIILDDDAPYQLNAGIVVARESSEHTLSRVSLLCYDSDGRYVSEVRHCLEASNVTVDVCHFGQPLPPQNDVISLLELQKPLLHGIREETFEIIKNCFCSHKALILWIMPAVQVGKVKDPQSALTLGLARTARNELSLPFLTVEVDETSTGVGAAATKITKIFRKTRFEHFNPSGSIDPDYEYAIVHEEILIPRLHWQTLSEVVEGIRIEDMRAIEGEKPQWRIAMRTPGLLHTLTWIPCEQSAFPIENEVLVESKVIGLNFRDILIALGIMENDLSEMGFEGSGIVRAVGPGVSRFSVGDRVSYLGMGCFKTTQIMNEALCVRLDDSMTFKEGAALPLVYATAYYALVEKANLQHGQSVLIHSACGGFGLSAIQIAQALGAEIYCTVGSHEKRNFLTENYGIEPSRIFSSRDTSFLPDVLNVTYGRGVDVVLNSLSGELLQASWQCVAEFGTMVEIGKRDFRRRATLAMAPFEANRTFLGIELGPIIKGYPRKASALFERCIEWIRAGRIPGPTISRSFKAVQIEEALRVMQVGSHIGKIVIEMPDDSREFEGQHSRQKASLSTIHFRSDRTYLLSTAVSPLAGVINLSMVLKDVGLPDMTFGDWIAPIEPKVQGTWNLHQATVHNKELDFFILLSSCSGVIGQWGQANYAAANTFLDAFVHFRRQQGLVASVIDLGVMGDVGFVSQNQGIRENLDRIGMYILREQDLLNALILALKRSSLAPSATAGQICGQNSDMTYRNPSQVLLGLNSTSPISSPLNRVPWRRDARMSIYHNTAISDNSGGYQYGRAKAQSSQSDDLRAKLASMANNEDKIAAIARSLAAALAAFLIKDDDSIALNRPLEQLGLDSLIALEIRNWIRQKLKQSQYTSDSTHLRVQHRAIAAGSEPNVLPLKIFPQHVQDAPKPGRPAKQAEEVKEQMFQQQGQHKDWTLEDWKNVIWTDETSVVINHRRGGYRVWRRADERVVKSCIRERWKGYSEFMFWGCFSYDKKGPCHVYQPETKAEKEDAARRIEQLNAELEPLQREEWELLESMRRIGLRNKRGRKPQWRWTEKTGKLMRTSGGGIDWWRRQTCVLIPKLIPFAKECL